MAKRGRFGKYGETKRFERLRQKQCTPRQTLKKFGGKTCGKLYPFGERGRTRMENRIIHLEGRRWAGQPVFS